MSFKSELKTMDVKIDMDTSEAVGKLKEVDDWLEQIEKRIKVVESFQASTENVNFYSEMYKEKRQALHNAGFRYMGFDVMDARDGKIRKDLRKFTWLRITPDGYMPYSEKYLRETPFDEIIDKARRHDRLVQEDSCPKL